MHSPGPVKPPSGGAAALRFSLSEGEVHVWTVDLNAAPALPAIFDCLSGDEQARAQRFRRPELGRRFKFGRGSVRHILAQYVDGDPAALRFHYGEFGKPELDLDSNVPLHFNVAHSDDVLLCAVGGVPLGIDLEAVLLPPESDAIAQRFFASSEWETLRALPKENRALGFTRCWTRKEAFIKAVGKGLSHPLDAFEVTLSPNEPARLVRIRGSVKEAERWSVMELLTQPGLVGAVALLAPQPRIRYLQLPDPVNGLEHNVWPGT